MKLFDVLLQQKNKVGIMWVNFASLLCLHVLKHSDRLNKIGCLCGVEEVYIENEWDSTYLSLNEDMTNV